MPTRTDFKRLPRCSCGESHQFDKATRRYLRRIIERNGRLIVVYTSQGAWRVPRVFLAAHQIDHERIPELAEIYGWVKEGK